MVANNESGTLPANSSGIQSSEQVPRIVTEISEKPAQQFDEQALESHEVIELQAFIERKAWIEEKIEVLEKMPPVEVFAGMEAIRTSAEEVPGLPSRDELERWVVEHDAIEKETEIFDSGEMKKLKKLTKAATQRNLSPEDTDLIELTLSVIYDLDKLVHLLRNRSENLDLLSIRLTWEEARRAAWSDIRTALADFGKFVETRARWSPSVYDIHAKNVETHTQRTVSRRGSVTSIASSASVLSDSTPSSPGFSRANRFKLADQLAKDAAQVTSRIAGLRQGRIAAAGKILDRLIDSSRKPVPDDILDEQDRLEERGITDLESLNKFMNGVILQWRKADEVYVETMKDQATAQNLIEELELAKTHSPNFNQSLLFFTRVEKLRKRLAIRSDPGAPGTTFPNPSHPLFPDQNDFNDSLASKLHKEVCTAADLARTADSLAKEYGVAAECVQQAETLLSSTKVLSKSFSSVIFRLQNGLPGNDKEGEPPLLTSESCLQPDRHSTFLAFLPSLQTELDDIIENSRIVLNGSSLTIMKLDKPGIDPSFRSDITSAVHALQAVRDQAVEVMRDVSARAAHLRQVRRVGACMEKGVKDLAEIHRRLEVLLQRNLWRRPDSSVESDISGSQHIVPLHTSVTPAELKQELDSICRQFTQEVEQHISPLVPYLEEPLSQWFARNVDTFKSMASSVTASIGLLQKVESQTAAMNSLRQEFGALQRRLDEMADQFDSQIQAVLSSELSPQELDIQEMDFCSSVEAAQTDVEVFTNGLSARVPFLGQYSPDIPDGDVPSGTPSYSEVLPVDFNGSLIDTRAVDASVRADCNFYAMRLSGGVQHLAQKLDHFKAARIARRADMATSTILRDIRTATEELSVLKASFPLSVDNDKMLGFLQDLSDQLESSSQSHGSRISPSFAPTRDLLHLLNEIPTVDDPNFSQNVCHPRRRALSDAEAKFTSWTEGVEALRAQIIQAMQVESRRLELEALELERLEKERVEQGRLTQERQIQADREKAQLADAERQRMEREKHELEERRKLAEERDQLRLERERILAEDVQHAKVEEERLAALEQLRLEEARIESERQLQLRKTRLAADEAEKVRAEHERLADEERQRLVADRLAEESRMRHEKEQLALEKARLEREQSDFAERLRTEEERLELERQQHAEREKAMSEEALRLRRDQANGDKAANVPDEDDVWGFQVTPSTSQQSLSQELIDLKSRILATRKQLRALGISELARPSAGSTPLPSLERVRKVADAFSLVRAEVEKLPRLSGNTSVDIELKSLRSETQGSSSLLEHAHRLGDLAHAVHACDAAFSDLLEHIDSYPAPPAGVLSSVHITAKGAPPEDQMSARLDYTQSLVDSLLHQATAVRDDVRGTTERIRISQTWAELEEMARDRILGQKSRPGSVVSTGRNSSGRNSSASVILPSTKKSQGYSSLSIGSSRGRFLAPSIPSSRRAVSGGTPEASCNNRSSSRLSTSSTNRSVSGPINSPFGSTYASRQRTTSLSSSATTSTGRNVGTPRARTRTGPGHRVASPAMSDASFTPSLRSTGRTGSSFGSTWPRAPRLSLTSGTTPQKAPVAPKKAYIPNPRSKLDVAVGDVVNKLPVNITVEGIAETWRDQSGKYWIGDQDPKLCFCRILRSHTVMVRVGGGWSELSKFIRDHFADSFRLIPETPHRRQGSREEKWISSSTLVEAPAENAEAPLTPPRTPEPKLPFVPAFALSTPSGNSPHSIKSSPSTKGSPLTPMQFLRRAEPESPSKSRNKRTMPSTPSRNAIWRP